MIPRRLILSRLYRHLQRDVSTRDSATITPRKLEMVHSLDVWAGDGVISSPYKVLCSPYHMRRFCKDFFLSGVL